MSKIIHRHQIHWTHLLATLVIGGYFFFSKINLVHALMQSNIIISFLQVYLFGAGFSLFLLYIFSHEKFFPVAKEIEEKEEKKEKSLLKKYSRHGKIFAIFVIGIIFGPIFSALTTRILLRNFRYKYLVIVLVNIPSTLFTLGIGRGILGFV